MSKRATIKDIAQMLNISTSTVSRAMTDRWDVNPETRKAVLEAAKQLNYRPNTISLSLRNQKTFSVAVVMPEFVNSFFAEVMIGIQSVLAPKNYHILVSQSNESAQTERDNLNMLESLMVDGFIVSITQNTSDDTPFLNLIEKGFPVVFFNRVCENVNAPKVIIDDRKWAFNATNHLIEQGCRRIVHLAGPNNLLVSRQRRAGYLDALRHNNISIDKNMIITTGLIMEQGVISTLKILKMDTLPDGIFAVTDPVAIGAIKTLKKNGIKVPQDISVVGFSESPMATIIEPNLTSVEQPTFEIGVAAAKLLLGQMEEITPPAQTIILNASLNIRESSVGHLSEYEDTL